MKLIDETGNQYGYLTVLYRAPNKNGRTSWHCRCKCGNECDVLATNLRKGLVKSCGCYKKEKAIENCEKMTEKNIINEIGNRYGLLTVIEQVPNTKKYRGAMWKCKCDCGNIIETTGERLRSGNTRSCGCVLSWKEKEIIDLFQKNNILFKTQYRFNDLYLTTPKNTLRFDFGILDKDNNLLGLIEYNGEQHYDIKKGFSKDRFEKGQKSDMLKENYCKKNNIPLLILNKENYNEGFILNWIKNLMEVSHNGN